MNIKDELINLSPTKEAKKAITFLSIGISAVLFLFPFLNQITLELSQKQLTWLQVISIIFELLLVSLYLNLHLYKWALTREKYLDGLESRIDKKIEKAFAKQNVEIEKKIHPLRGILDITEKNL